jgi:hypothetical protein
MNKHALILVCIILPWLVLWWMISSSEVKRALTFNAPLSVSLFAWVLHIIVIVGISLLPTPWHS